MGINRLGNNQKVQKTEIESLIDFRVVGRGKSNKVLTKNLTSFIAGAEPKLAKLILFLIFESNSSNVVEFNTHLLQKYGTYLKETTLTFGGKEFLPGSVSITRNHFIKVISMGILIPINPDKKLYLINPALLHYEGHYRQHYEFCKGYEKVYEKYAMGGMDKGKIHELIVHLAKQYYNDCH